MLRLLQPGPWALQSLQPGLLLSRLLLLFCCCLRWLRYYSRWGWGRTVDLHKHRLEVMLEGWHWDYCDRACLLVEDEESTHCHFNGSKRFVKEHGNKVHNCLMFSVPFDSLLCNEYICNFRQQLVEGCKKLVPEGMTVHVVNPHGIILCKFVLDFLKPDCQVAAETLVIISNFDSIIWRVNQIFLQETLT